MLMRVQLGDPSRQQGLHPLRNRERVCASCRGSVACLNVFRTIRPFLETSKKLLGIPMVVHPFLSLPSRAKGTLRSNVYTLLGRNGPLPWGKPERRSPNACPFTSLLIFTPPNLEESPIASSCQYPMLFPTLHCCSRSREQQCKMLHKASVGANSLLIQGGPPGSISAKESLTMDKQFEPPGQTLIIRGL